MIEKYLKDINGPVYISNIRREKSGISSDSIYYVPQNPHFQETVKEWSPISMKLEDHIYNRVKAVHIGAKTRYGKHLLDNSFNTFITVYNDDMIYDEIKFIPNIETTRDVDEDYLKHCGAIRDKFDQVSDMVRDINRSLSLLREAYGVDYLCSKN